MPSWSTPGTYTWQVPANVNEITVTVQGGSGGAGAINGGLSGSTSQGGLGAVVSAVIPATSGQQFTIYVASEGSSTLGVDLYVPGGTGYSAGGDGGSSDPGNSSQTVVGGSGGGSSAIVSGSTLYVIAGGGGGGAAAAFGTTYTSAGGNSGENGSSAASLDYYSNDIVTGGGGATQSAPGAAATGSIEDSTSLQNNVTTPSAGTGPGAGVGGDGLNTNNATTNSGIWVAGGGGGAGYYGGGGGGGNQITSNPLASAATGGGGGSSWAGNGASNISYSTASSAGNGSVTITYSPAYTAPNAPTLSQPGNASYIDASQDGVTPGGYYNSTDNQNQNAYCVEVAASGGAWSYYNSSTNAWQSTPYWISSNIAPGGFFSITIGASLWSNSTTYNWSMASQEAGENLQGPFATPFTFVSLTPPSVTVTAPTGTTSSGQPTVEWTGSFPSGASQTAYRVVISSAAGPSGTTYWDSGTVTSTATSAVVGNVLYNGNYYAYVMLTETGGETSAWAYSQFTVQYDVPSTPIVTATAGTDPNGVPANIITVQGTDNILDQVSSTIAASNTGAWESALNTTTSFGGPVNGLDSGPNGANLVTQYGTAVVGNGLTAFKQGLQAAVANAYAYGPYGDTAANGYVTGTAMTAECIVWFGAAPANNSAAWFALYPAQWYLGLLNNNGTVVPAAYWYDSGGTGHLLYGSSAVSGNTWLALSWDGSTIRLFQNGTLVASASVSSIQKPVASNLFLFGPAAFAQSVQAGMMIDEFRFSTVARYTANYTAPTAEFTSDSNTGCLYHFDGGIQSSSTVASDGQYSLELIGGGYASWTAPDGYIAPGQPYSVQAQFNNDVSGSYTNYLYLNWLDVNGNLISQEYTTIPTTGPGWVQGSFNTTSPGTAASCAVVVEVPSAGGYVDKIGVQPGTDTPWALGGFVGQQQVSALRSDGIYVRNAGYSTADPTGPVWGVNTTELPAQNQLAIFYDYEEVPGTTYTYTVQLEAEGQFAQPVVSNPVTLSLGSTSWWIIDPLNPAASFQAAVTAQTTSQYKLTGANYPLSDDITPAMPNVTSLGTFGQSGTLTIQTGTGTEYTNLMNLVQSRDVKWLIDPFGTGQYMTLAIADPTQGGISGQTHSTTIKGGTATNPYRQTNLIYTEVSRP